MKIAGLDKLVKKNLLKFYTKQVSLNY